MVAPFAGAWIEIINPLKKRSDFSFVAPFAGAWIEILGFLGPVLGPCVAPFAGAWIEIIRWR